MNVRKPADYSALFATMDKLDAAALPQMELYCEIGRLVSSRPEKGAAVAAAEYLSSEHPDATSFSPRNLRRIREFYRAYVDTPEVLAQAMAIGWTQNVVILEAELTIQERAWYIRAVQQFGWSKLELQRQIAANAHTGNALDFEGEVCYTEENSDSTEGISEESKDRGAVSNQIRCHQHQRVLETDLSISVQLRQSRNRMHQEDSVVVHLYRLRPPGRDGPDQPVQYTSHLRW